MRVQRNVTHNVAAFWTLDVDNVKLYMILQTWPKGRKGRKGEERGQGIQLRQC
jgi:hypothetical protein